MPRHPHYVPARRHPGRAAAVQRRSFDRRDELPQPPARRGGDRGHFRHHRQRAFDRGRRPARSTSSAACSRPPRTRSARGCRSSTACGPTAAWRRRALPAWRRTGGASALLVFPPAPFTLGQSPEMALAHFKRIADATDLPIIVFQYPLATGQGYPRDTLLRMVEQVPAIRAIKDWAGNVAAARDANPDAAEPGAAGQRAHDPQRLAAFPRWCSAATGSFRAAAA